MKLLTAVAGLCLSLIGSVPPASAAPGAVAAGDHDYTLSWAGRNRDYRVYIPPSYTGAKPVPLLIALHGGFGTGPGFEDQSHLDRVADQYGFIVAYPDGWRRSWNAGSCCFPASTHHIDDVGFLNALKTKLLSQFAIDRSRVYGTGFSNGAMMVQRMACDSPTTFAAIASVEGGIMVPLDSCTTKTPTPTLIIGGLLDKRIPWNGGVFKGTYRPSVKQMVDLIGTRNQCEATTETVYNANQVLCRTRKNCVTGDAVSWCRIDNGGHQWAGGKTVLKFLLGPNNEAFDASQYIWKFLSRFQRAPTD
ncbi:MAG TPA: PHB depolymerase family esterase [Nevskiaceae bacterium]|nr:PHB depolymerase family esterase [Nevskiaceae bacterium]